MNKRSFFSFILVIAVFAGCSQEQESPTKVGNIASIDSLIQDAVDKEHIPGAVIRLQQGDSVLHFKAYGFAQKYRYGMEELKNPEPMQVEHLFDLASLTKVFATTFGIMVLNDRGQLSLNDPVSDYLEGFKRESRQEITIRHLLTHSSGLPQWFPLYYLASNKEERLEAISGMPLEWKVGKGRHYSDLGFMILGDVIERVSGQTLDEFLQQEFYGMLNLSKTVFNPLDKGFSKIAATSHGNPFEKRMVYDDDFGYRVDVDPESWDGWREYTLKGEVNDGNSWYANGGVAGHAGLFSTAEELQVMINLLLHEGRHRGEQVISKAVIDTFLTKDRFGNGLGWAMDKGFIAAEGTPEGTFGHTGFTGTNVVVIPEENLSIIFLTNRQNSGLQKNGTYFNLKTLRQQIITAVMNSTDSTKMRNDD
ncbi:serine hydrolase [Balneolaceae bacterium YR4-1]|uniref:Serine hydrolase n=1 Tax=Halalkalibaculum roseum TaxID=2709311 RepID=A0A6M1TBB7_9BACT|nr:serine hydrolase [Halalkalibaculum roseum]NGP77423.1 serine hydrolase [Halalkalibaculum roseum]